MDLPLDGTFKFGVARHWCGLTLPEPVTYPTTAPPLCESRRRR